MSRNAESHFASVPHADIERSRFDRSSRLLTTCNSGRLIPLLVTECLPGDTVTVDVASLIRMSTPIFPVMDNAFADIYWFYTPTRLLWTHWREFNGENRSGYWAQPNDYVIPQISAPSNGGWDKGSIADYFGLPTNVSDYKVSHLPFRAYNLIWNEFFRDQNYMSPADFYDGDDLTIGQKRSANADGRIPYTNSLCGGDLLPVCKVHDYFTSVLPAPQKAPGTEVPLFNAHLPVSTMNPPHGLGDTALHFSWTGSASLSGAKQLSMTPNASMSAGGTGTVESSIGSVYPDNLYVNLGDVEAGTINQLRQAFQIQRLLERDARGGTRYYETLKAHFGVTSPDSRLQRPEYLGGKRIPINVDQVVQTSQSTSDSPQGNTAAYSLTTDVSSAFTKSFVEHGYLMCLMCIRTDHTYQQGIERFWSRQRRFDFYWPALAHLGEQAVLKKEVVCTGTQYDDDAFGYQEAWADYRYQPSRVTGAFRSNYSGTLDSWHYADYFPVSTSIEQNSFVADEDFMRETQVNIDRTLAVSSEVEDQFLCNFYFKSIWTRPMPLYSVPGMIDHF